MSYAKADAEVPYLGSAKAPVEKKSQDTKSGAIKADSEGEQPAKTESVNNLNKSSLRFLQYDQSKEDVYLTAIRQLISKDLSEPYSIYVYRYFLYQWGHLCFLVCTPNLDSASSSCYCVM